MRLIYFSFVILTILGCKSIDSKKPGVKIPIDYNLKNVLPFSESGYTFEIEIIPLENLKEAYIKFSELHRMEVFENFYYIMTLGGKVKIFHKDGKFLTQIRNGRGPGEIIMPLDISFDIERKKLEILEVNGIKIFDLVGNYENSVQIQKKYIEFVRFGDIRIFLDSNQDSNQKFNYIIMDKKGELINFEKKYGPTIERIISPRHFNVYNDELYLCSNNSNVIYKLDKRSKTPEKFAFIEEMNSNQSISGIKLDDYKKLCEKNNWFNRIAGFSRMDDSLFQLSISKGFIKTYFFNMSKNQIYDHPLKDLPILFKPIFINKLDEYFLFPSEILNEKIEKTFIDKNPNLYSKLKTEMMNETEIENLKVIHISYKKVINYLK
ncbi:MAG: hypothetical protein AB9922_07920 [Bacteroidales bacterium]